jgi:hypothetical protein
MGFTLTSPNKTVSITSPYAIFEGQIGSAEGIFVYLNYTKGNEGGLKMSILSMDKNVDAVNYFQHVKADGNYALSQLFFSLAASARVRVPITLAPGDGKIKLLFETLSGAALDGTLEVDVRCG